MFFLKLLSCKFEILYSWLPERIKIKDPYRLFLSNEDGFSLREMVVKSYSHYPTVLILQSTNGEVNMIKFCYFIQKIYDTICIDIWCICNRRMETR